MANPESPSRQAEDRASDPPGAVSDQNLEEQESGHRADRSHPEPRTGGTGGGGASGRSDEPAKQPPDASGAGAATEGSQATGHPENAG
jgi:hypothetical protein